ncbi:putative gp42 dCMP hydroxymethylase [Delftia phage PhiW-14]|uniref:Putative gp42 dCMP hydroxymethylase n=1 Tax=Delftia phage PhiW-14 TaxID=665032 RepID=C9DGC1_BPW14|nr:putative gp42 dCMP hydroxymethylase [Delftia phage PhiW-14]ACV50172.1 putative gp42 dCMP hydroxymethylase [Delftia phage PhiW-14]
MIKILKYNKLIANKTSLEIAMNTYLINEDKAPIADKAWKITGPKWVSRHGKQMTSQLFSIGRVNGSEPKQYGWQLVIREEGQVYIIVEMFVNTSQPTHCQTMTEALWTLREILASEIRSDVRSTNNH